MAQYSDPDQWISESQVPWGSDPTHTESIKSSWVATNRAAYAALGIVQGIGDALGVLPDHSGQAAVDKLLAVRFAFGNQDGVPDDKKGTDTIISSINATNQQVFSPANGLGALSAKLDAVEAKLDQVLAALAPKPAG